MSIRSDEQKIQELIDSMLAKTEQSVTMAYVEAADAVREKLNRLYATYAKDGVLTYAEMQKSKRFEALMAGIEKELVKLGKKVDPALAVNSADAFQTSYYGTNYAIGNNIAAETNIMTLPKKAILASVNAPVGGVTLFQRLGEERYMLLIKQREVITQGLIQGWPINRMAQAIDDRFGVGLNNALRISRTETTRNTGEGQSKAYDDLEEQDIVIKRKWIATHDDRTRNSHAHLDGTFADKDGYFYLSGNKAKAPGGFGVASKDINCRCRVVAILEEYDSSYPKYKSYADYAKENKIKY